MFENTIEMYKSEFFTCKSLVGQRAVAQLGRASEPTRLNLVDGDAVDIYQW